MVHRRAERVGDTIKEEIAQMITMGEVKDPRIGLVTVTKVKMSPDMKYAVVFFSMTAPLEEIQETTEGLKSASPYIRRALAKRLSLRHVPSVDFKYDDSLDYAMRIEEALKKIKETEQ